MTVRTCVAFLVLVACGDDDGTINPDAGADSGFRIDGGADTGTDAASDSSLGDVGTDAPDPPGWIVRSHSCPGINRTDAFHVDPDGTMWLGCGSGTIGDGLFVSSDGGSSWSIPATQPANVLESFRVVSVHRGFGDLIYVAGEGPAQSMVVSLDTSVEPFAVETVLTRGTTIGTAFLASPFVTTTSGAAIADSFNGHDLLYRPDADVDDAAASWVNAGDWEDDGGSHQILDLLALGERFVGCGSTIAEPPLVFLPSLASGAEPWEMTPVDLVGSGLGSYTGEMWGVAASDDRVVVVGVDQDNDIGKIFVSGADLYDASEYTQIDIDPLLPSRVTGGDSTWARGVCMRGDRVVVVGEIQPLGAGDNSGFVLESIDGGVTFTDVTPEGSPDTWSKCSLQGDVLRIAGAGAIAILN